MGRYCSSYPVVLQSPATRTSSYVYLPALEERFDRQEVMSSLVMLVVFGWIETQKPDTLQIGK